MIPLPPFKSDLLFIYKDMEYNPHTQEISGRRHNNFSVCPMEDSLFWLHISATTTDVNFLQNVCQSVQKQWREGRKKEEKVLKN